MGFSTFIMELPVEIQEKWLIILKNIHNNKGFYLSFVTLEILLLKDSLLINLFSFFHQLMGKEDQLRMRKNLSISYNHWMYNLSLSKP